MLNNFYVDSHISKSALNTFLAHFKVGGDELHTLEVTYRGARVVTYAPAPYRVTDKREIYSLSKSFCSTCIGILVTRGLLSTEERIVDIFPEEVPEVVSENLGKMRVGHVLSMNTGHPSCVMGKMIRAENPVKAFLEQPVPYEPGTHFAYNTGATCLLSCIVEKRSGMHLIDFITKNLFLPLGIEGVRWNHVNAGPAEGGCGIHVSCDDITKLGLLYAQGGVWNGKRILSEDWVKTATSPISDNSMNGTPDWCAGYGYQFWVNAREGFRGDGAFGQLCVVLPKHELVFALQTELGNMQTELDAIMVFADRMFDDDTEMNVSAHLYSAFGSAQTTAGMENQFYQLDGNTFGFSSVYLTYSAEENASHAVFCDGVNQWTVKAGNGYWAESTVYAKHFKPKLVGLMSTDECEPCRLVASYEAKDGMLTYHVRFLNCPHKMTYTFTKEDNLLRIHFENSGLLEANARDLIGREDA